MHFDIYSSVSELNQLTGGVVLSDNNVLSLCVQDEGLCGVSV